MVTRFSSISTRKLSKALDILTANKTMVAMSDYDDYHRTVKRNILTAVLGPNAQVRVENVCSCTCLIYFLCINYSPWIISEETSCP